MGPEPGVRRQDTPSLWLKWNTSALLSVRKGTFLEPYIMLYDNYFESILCFAYGQDGTHQWISNILVFKFLFEMHSTNDAVNNTDTRSR
jgi:hypothetical protein